MKPLVILCLVLAFVRSGASAPVNDNFANATVLTGIEHFVLTDNLGATVEPGEPSHDGTWSPSSSVWWRWTAPSNTPVSLDLSGSGFSPALAVYTGNALNSLTLVARDHFDGSFEPGRSRLGFYATAGQVYRIVVAGVPDGFLAEQGMVALSLMAGPKTRNDFFANAYTIAPGTLSVSGSHLGTSREPGEPDNAGGSNGRSIWWRWTAQSNGPVRLDTAGSSFSPNITVYTGNSLGALAFVDEDFGNSDRDAFVSFQAVSGTTYRIVVDDERDSGEVVLNFRRRPPNDNFANRIVLTGTTVTAFGENWWASKEASEPNHANAFGTNSVWWRWTAPAGGLYTLDTIGSSFVPALAVYTGNAVGALTPIGNMDGSDASASRVRFSATQGTTYNFAVDADFIEKLGGDIVLNLAPSETTLGNDLFANRINITQFPAVLRGSNVGANQEANEIPSDQFNSMWWRFVAPSNGLVTLQKAKGVPSLRFVVLEGTSVTALTVAADSQDATLFPPRVDCSLTCPVVGGRTYVVSIGNGNPFFRWTPGLDQGDFAVNLSFTAAPANDNFINRIVIPSGTTTVSGTTLGATTETGEPPIGTNANSIWWSYTPSASGPITLTTVGSSIDTALGVYTGNSVGALTRVATNDAAYTWPVITGPSNDRPSRVTFNGVAGQAYRIAVSTARGAAGDVVLNLPTLAIADLLSVSSALQSDRNLNFSANLRLRNLNPYASGPLRIRTFARAGFSHLDGLFADCGKGLPAMNIADQELIVTNLPSSGTISAQGSVDMVVTGTCPPPYERGEWGQGWGAMAVLEELAENGWELRDSRLLVFGNWPLVGGFIGPGGGVITVASGTGQVLSSPGFIDLTIGPPAALRLGARWRVSPTNFGSLNLYTNFSTQSVVLVTRDNNFSIDITNLAGFNMPSNRSVRIRAGFHTNLDLTYSVLPPRLFYDRSTGLSLTGTVGTAYRIEGAGGLQAPTWTSNAGRTLTAGKNTIPNTTPVAGTNRFYRAFWLSN